MSDKTIRPLSAAIHYHAGLQFWESRAKSLQNTVDAQEEELGQLRARLERYEPSTRSAESDMDARDEAATDPTEKPDG